MTTTKQSRPYTAPHLADRCEATRKPLRDGTTAQCMRRKAPGQRFCPVHAAEAERMNARPLPVSEDNAMNRDWCDIVTSIHAVCDSCGRSIGENKRAVMSGGGAAALLVLCEPCAKAECERAESEHRAADPHCTCNDCLAHHAATTKGE